jgi:hypothetical protein
MITFRRSDLVRMWRTVRALEAALSGRSDADLAKLVSDARHALTRPPLSGPEAMELERWKDLVRVRRGLPTPAPQAQLEARIKAQIDANMQQAARALADAAARLGGADRNADGPEAARP